jgi:dTDP-4-amino-4,6-dideoxygalactose transaminase
VLTVHIYGQPAELSALAEIARGHSLRLIEDYAQSHGALYCRKPAGSIGDIACFSFYPTKNLGALGDRGMVVTSDSALAAALREKREYGWRDRYVSARVGINSRLGAMRAAILGVKLNNLAADSACRQTIAARYGISLKGLPLTLPVRRPNATHVFHQYVIRLAERDALRDRLRAARIGTGLHYLHRQPAYNGRVVPPSGLRVTERAAPQILSLPMYPQLPDQAVARVIAEIHAFFG